MDTSACNICDQSERINPNFVPSVRTNGRKDQKLDKIAALLLSLALPLPAAKTDVAQKLESHQNEVAKTFLVPETQARTHFAWLRNVRMGDLELAGSDQTSGSSQSLESHFPEGGKRKRISAYSYHSYPFASDCICNLQFLAGSLSVPPRPSTRSWLSKLARKWVHFRSELRSHPILAACLTSANQLAREINSFLLMASR